MTDRVEKSCWGITAWAIVIVIGAVLVASMVAAPEKAAESTTFSSESRISKL